MTYEFYKIVHFFGIFSLFFSYGGLIMFYHLAGTDRPKAKKPVSMIHGISLLIVLVGGMGLAARLHLPFPFPTWIWIKFTMWLALGGLIVLARRRPQQIWPLYAVVILMGTIAAISAVYKPGA